MPAKDIKRYRDAHEGICRDIDLLADAVKVTLGPKGRNVLIDKGYGAPRITKDGMTVAREIERKDKFENMGAQMLRAVASRSSSPGRRSRMNWASSSKMSRSTRSVRRNG